MKHLLKVLLVLPLIALAEPVTLNWNNPTQYTDGTPLDPANIKQTRMEYGSCNGNAMDVVAGEQVILGAAETMDVDRPVGTHCFLAYTMSTDDLESGPSNVAMKTVAPAPVPPMPPQNLTVVADNLTAYTLIQSVDRLALIPVGTVPPGTQCDSSQDINGKYVVPKALVSWAGSVVSEVVVADCV